MLIEPPIEKMSQKVGNKYKLCVLASKRALELQVKNIEAGVEPEETELTQAANEIWAGDVVADDDDNI
jgi:DNA-directed RNA polymerase omega subunit